MLVVWNRLINAIFVHSLFKSVQRTNIKIIVLISENLKIVVLNTNKIKFYILFSALDEEDIALLKTYVSSCFVFSFFSKYQGIPYYL